MRLTDDLTAAIRTLADDRLDDRAVDRVRLATLGALRRELDVAEAQRGQTPLWSIDGGATR